MPLPQFDFRTPRRAFSRLGIGLLLAGLIALALLGARLHTVSDARQALRWQLAAHTPKSEQARPATPTAQVLAGSQADAAIARHLAASWQPLFAALERATPPHIALLALDCSGTPGRLSATAEARTLADALDYVARLNRSPGLAHVLLSHYQVADSDPEHPVRFEFQGRIAP